MDDTLNHYHRDKRGYEWGEADVWTYDAGNDREIVFVSTYTHTRVGEVFRASTPTNPDWEKMEKSGDNVSDEIWAALAAYRLGAA